MTSRPAFYLRCVVLLVAWAFALVFVELADLVDRLATKRDRRRYNMD